MSCPLTTLLYGVQCVLAQEPERVVRISEGAGDFALLAGTGGTVPDQAPQVPGPLLFDRGGG